MWYWWNLVYTQVLGTYGEILVGASPTYHTKKKLKLSVDKFTNVWYNMFVKLKRRNENMEIVANERITTKDFAKEYAEKNDISIAKSNEIVSNFLNTLKEVIKRGKGVQLYGFGNIDVFTLPKGEVRNPLTQEFVTKPERNKVKFKFSQAFKKEVE